MGQFGKNYVVVSWSLYSIGILLICCRMISRWIQLRSFTKFGLDDWLMLIAGATLTGMTITSNILAIDGSNYLPPEVLEQMTASQREKAIYGSKMTVLMEEFTLVTLWIVKACMLLLYHRFTIMLRRHILVVAVACYCVLGFIITQVFYLGVWCRPLRGYWTLGEENEQCVSWHHHLITASVFNISSDLMMLLIPLPLLVTSKLPVRRKLVLCLVFSLGLFCILSTGLNRYFAFTLPYNPDFLNWYMGEISTAVYVSNIPLCWPLIRHIFSLSEFNTAPRPYLSPPQIHSPQPAPQAPPKSTLDTTVCSREIIETPPPSATRPHRKSRSGKPITRTSLSISRHSQSVARGSFEEIEDSWQDMFTPSHGREIDEEKAIGWNPYLPELDLVDYRKVDLQRLHTDGIVRTVRVSQYSETCSAKNIRG